MNRLFFALVLCFIFLLVACEQPQEDPACQTNTNNSTIIVDSSEEKTFYKDTDIEIIALEDPFSNYYIPVVADDLESYITLLCESKSNIPDLQAFCDYFGVSSVKMYHSSFYGDVYCTVVRTCDTLVLCTFVSEGADIWSYSSVIQSTTVSKAMLDPVAVGDSVNSIRQIDPNAIYRESYGSMGYPANSIHYTTDGYLIYIEYDRKWNIVDIATISIRSTE